MKISSLLMMKKLTIRSKIGIGLTFFDLMNNFHGSFVLQQKFTLEVAEPEAEDLKHPFSLHAAHHTRQRSE